MAQAHPKLSNIPDSKVISAMQVIGAGAINFSHSNDQRAGVALKLLILNFRESRVVLPDLCLISFTPQHRESPCCVDKLAAVPISKK